MELEVMVLGKISQKQKDTHYIKKRTAATTTK